MNNDFVLVGPSEAPAEITRGQDVTTALTKIAEAKAPVASRGDESGTHKAESRLWRQPDADPTASSGTWSCEMGSGMVATLDPSMSKVAHALSYRSTWIALRNKGSHRVLVEGDESLFNQYGVIARNTEPQPRVKVDLAGHFVDWIPSPAGQTAISA